jgi:hypothetical protein
MTHRAYQHPFVTNETAPEAHWPTGVRRISLEGVGQLGVDAQGVIYFDGQAIQMQRRVRLGGIELWIAGAATLATVVQAALDVLRFVGAGA